MFYSPCLSGGQHFARGRRVEVGFFFEHRGKRRLRHRTGKRRLRGIMNDKEQKIFLLT